MKLTYSLTLLSALFGCSPSGEQPISPEISPSLVLITLDTTRADRIGAYGYNKAATPTIDGFAADGVLFKKAYSTVPLTTPAHASIMTGLYPPRHGIRNNGDAILGDDMVTLAERLKEEGYDTAAAVSAFVTTSVWNLNQGFDYFSDEVDSQTLGNRWGQERPAEQVVDDLVGWLEQERDNPVFIWAHFYDPHHPHVAPEGFAGFEDPYDAEIAYVDAQIARLKVAVEAVSDVDKTAWIIVADHGESFNREHGETSHGLFLFDSTMRVPFIIKAPRGSASLSTMSDSTVSIVDVTPTALGMLGIENSDELDGVDLLTLSEARQPVYMEATMPSQRFGYHPEIAAAQGDLKLMDTPNPRLFNTQNDPDELRNIIDQHPSEVETLSALAQEVWESAISGDGGSISPEVLAQLAQLGYVSNDFSANGNDSTIDAKDKVDTIMALENIRSEMQTEHDFAKAVEAYRKLIETEPQLAEARLGMAKALSAMGKFSEAEVVFREALEREPGSNVLKTSLAQCLAAQGRHKEGSDLMLAVLEQVPGDLIAQTGALRMLSDQKRDAEARILAEEWFKINPEEPTLLAHLGFLKARAGELDEAEKLLTLSLVDEVPRQLVQRTLGKLALDKGELDEAIAHFMAELKYFTYDLAFQRETALLLMHNKRWFEASQVLHQICQLDKGDGMARLQWAQAVFNLEQYEHAEQIITPLLQGQPNNPQVLLLHANILAKLGNMGKAKETFERAKALNQSQRSKP